MSFELAPRLLFVALATLLATALLAALAPRLGWTDAPRLARKLQRRPVPAVGGAALLLGLACARGTPWALSGDELWGRWLPAPEWRGASLALLFAVGTWDDRAGFGPARKVVLQLLGLLPLALGAWNEHGALAALALAGVGFAALNLLNTFDNADGALASLCALGFGGVASSVSAACLGFLPLNLDAARARNRASAAPSAYLGDAGAFVLAFLVLLAPRSAGLLVLPALDLARLAWSRWRAGSRPWIGDRAHLAHRLAARGLGRPLVAATQCILAWPACALVARALALGDARPALLGIGASAALYALVLRATPGPPSDACPRAVPCSPPGGSE